MNGAGAQTVSQLEEERQFLLTSLRDLEAERAAGDIEEADYLALRDNYTARAATVLRALAPAAGAGEATRTPGENAAAQAAGVRRVAPRSAGRRGWRTAVAVVALAAGAGLAGYAVAGAAGERSATDEATGSLPEGSVDRITKAQALVSEGKVLEAIRVYDSLLADDPENPVALAQRGWLVSRVDPSLVDSGLASIDRALATDPDYAEAHFFRGMILWRSKGDPAAGAEAFQRAIDTNPGPQLTTLLQQVRDQALAAASGAPPPAP
ncbi:MAG: tetratricopeptide repeat protein [Actinobacteria bacterium]|nr:tetratricopeptide repeat protein [Actinomycetota bacterium]